MTTISNKFKSYIPLMNEWEYKFIEKYLTSTDILLEWGSGNSTIYWSGIVSSVISLEHDIDWINDLSKVIDAHEIKNIDLRYIPANSPNPIPCRYAQFKDYIHYPVNNNLKFTKVLIDGRARKYCAKYIWDSIDENVILFIHDFNRPDYQMTLKYYDLIDVEWRGQGIAALKKKTIIDDDGSYY
jgi:hypothetical protein